MATIQIKHVPDEVHRKLRTRAANSGKSLQQYMLEMACRQADIVTMEEMIARKRAEAIAYGEVSVDRDMIVEIIRADRESH